MQISKVLLIGCLAGAAMLQSSAQPASPELQDKALELLRQSTAQPAAQPAPEQASQPAAVAPQPAGVQAQVNNPSSPEQQQRALELLRQQIVQQQAAGASSSEKAAAAKHAKESNKKSTSAAKSAGPATSSTSGMSEAAPATNTTPAPATPGQAGGPKTKQERLMDLLEQYKADKLTPAQYHAERAKILSEP